MVRVRARFASTRDLDITGNVTVAGTLYGNGAYLEGMPYGDASALTRGTIAPERLPQYLGGDATVFTGDSMTVRDLVSDRLAGDGRQIANIDARNITCGVLGNDILPKNITFESVAAGTVTANTISAVTVSGCGAGLTGLVAGCITGILPQTAFPADFGSAETRFTGKSVVVSGDIQTTNGSFCGDGTFLTGIQAASLTGRIPASALPETIRAAEIVCDAVHANIVTGTFTGNGIGLTGLCANSIITGIISHDRLPSPLGTSTTHLVGADVTLRGDLHVGGTIHGDGSGITGIDAATMIGPVPAACLPRVIGSLDTVFIGGDFDARHVQTDTLRARTIHATEIRVNGVNVKHPPRAMTFVRPTTREYTLMCAPCDLEITKVVVEAGENAVWEIRYALDRTDPGHVLVLCRDSVQYIDSHIPKNAFVWIDVTSLGVLGLCEELFVSLEF